MEKRFWILLVVSILVIVSCTDHRRMEGHWHFTPTNIRGSDGTKHVMDYYKNVGLWNKGVHSAWPARVFLNVWNNELEISNGECFREEYFYQFKLDSLFLLNKQNEVVYNGYKCDLNCCNKEEDYFLHTDMEIKLAHLQDTSRSVRLSHYRNQGANRIYVGKDKTGSLKIQLGGYLPEFSEMSRWIEKIEDSYNFETTQRHDIIMHVDSDVDSPTIRGILAKLGESEVKHVSFGTIESTILKEGLVIRLVTVPTDIEFREDGFSFGNWVNGVNSTKYSDPKITVNSNTDTTKINQTIAGKKEGKWKTFHENGQLKREGNYLAGLKEGLHKEWQDNGILSLEGHYAQGTANGLMKWYHEKGHLAGSGNMKNGKREGKWIICDIEENGFCIKAYFENDKREGIWTINHQIAIDKVWKQQTYKNDKLIAEKCWDEKGEVIVCE